MSLFDINRRLQFIDQQVQALIAEKDRLANENQKLMLENDYLRDKINLLEEIAIQLREENKRLKAVK